MTGRSTGVSVRRGLVGAAVLVAGALLALAAPATALAAPATALAPIPGGAEVDGSAAEWSPGDDVAALVGNDPPHLERGRLSLRYDCEREVLSALLTAGPGLRLLADDPDEAYLRLGAEPKLVSGTDPADGDAPDAAWVDLEDGTAAAIEMAAPLPPGRYPDLRVHAKIPNASADGYETIDLLPRYAALDVACADPAAAELSLTVGRAADPGASDALGDPPGLARTGSPAVPLLVVAGGALIVAGAAVRLRRPARR